MVKLQIGYSFSFEALQHALESLGYTRVPLVTSPGDYAMRGSIIDIFPGNQNLPLRLEFFGEDLEDMRSFEPASQRSVSRVKSTEIVEVAEESRSRKHVIPHELLFTLNPGDFVVHIHHGVGVYKGLERLTLLEYEAEYAIVEYQEGDKIYVPVEQLNRLYKFTGASLPAINSLRDQKWQQTKVKVKKAVKNVAKDLFFLYKARKLKQGFAFNEDTEYDLELQRSFPFEETPDQKLVIEAVKADMELPKSMDRLVCGDVGFGKTEVAIRAVFKAVMSHKQVAVLTPTTLLCKQHYRVFKERLEPFGVTVDYVNRFKTRKYQKQTLDAAATGKLDILVGTHRLLQKDVAFADLGLLVVDEEQRFGVLDKERIKQMRLDVDVLTLSATPLPRTLYLSISGIRDISIIATPPLKRLPIITEMHVFDLEFIRDKILAETSRGGQVFLLHNRVMDMMHLQQQLAFFLPNVGMRIAHGQMKAHELEDIMVEFYDNKFSVLLSTTIIENGIDIPNVHTILIDRADHFGLAQLHQLRGRVGRDDTQSYCYLLYREEALSRVEVLERFEALIEYNTLGSGYDIALRDLELRGIGNILGLEQSGYMEAVGFDLYMHLLNQAISEEKGHKVDDDRPAFALVDKGETYVPDTYIPDMTVRLDLYKKIAMLRSVEQVRALIAECEDRYGPLPQTLESMLNTIQKELAKNKG